MSDQAAQDALCEHNWVSIHQPDLPIYYVDQCSQCHRFNAKRMREEIKNAGYWKDQNKNLVENFSIVKNRTVDPEITQAMIYAKYGINTSENIVGLTRITDGYIEKIVGVKDE